MNTSPGAAATRASANDNPSRAIRRADPFERGEGGVTLVEVQDVGVEPESSEGADTADAQNELLLDAGLLVAAVEPRRDPAVGPAVPAHGRVEQEQLVAADCGACQTRAITSRPGKGTATCNGPAQRVACHFDRQLPEIEDLPRFLLVPVVVEPLVRRLAIQQPDTDERHAESAR